MNRSNKSLHHKIQMHQISQPKTLQYFLYTPTQLKPNARILVAVHGISRNARKQARLFANYAEQYGVVVVSPLFDKQHYSGYQRLGLSGERADLALNEVLNEVSNKTQANIQKIYLFGYSGGGQFVHRYAMAYPNKVMAMAIGAAGWYTFPTPEKRFPYGTAPHPKLPDLTFNSPQFLRIPSYVLVGEKDTLRDKALRKSEKLDKQQGFNRFERGQNWIKSMKKATQQQGFNTPFHFITLPHSGHSFTRSVQDGGMAKHIFHTFFEKSSAKTTTLEPRKNVTETMHYLPLKHALSN